QIRAAHPRAYARSAAWKTAPPSWAAATTNSRDAPAKIAARTDESRWRTPNSATAHGRREAAHGTSG
ncbi:hypothetical protein ABTP87_19460, partial [Acinetobacter baumannii]